MTSVNYMNVLHRTRRLLPLLALGSAVAAQGQDTPPVTAVPATLSALSPANAVRQAQAEFERARRDALGFSSGGATSEPDVQFGSIFYWNNNNDVPPRPERPEIGMARRRFPFRAAALHFVIGNFQRQGARGHIERDVLQSGRLG